ncbi:uncharacterized protein LOC143233500 isoform X2 [Tachypleus tridentatus]
MDKNIIDSQITVEPVTATSRDSSTSYPSTTLTNLSTGSLSLKYSSTGPSPSSLTSTLGLSPSSSTTKPSSTSTLGPSPPSSPMEASSTSTLELSPPSSTFALGPSPPSSSSTLGPSPSFSISTPGPLPSSSTMEHSSTSTVEPSPPFSTITLGYSPSSSTIESSSTSILGPSPPSSTSTLGPSPPSSTSTLGSSPPSSTSTLGPSPSSSTSTQGPSPSSSTSTLGPSPPSSTSTLGPSPSSSTIESSSTSTLRLPSSSTMETYPTSTLGPSIPSSTVESSSTVPSGGSPTPTSSICPNDMEEKNTRCTSTSQVIIGFTGHKNGLFDQVSHMAICSSNLPAGFSISPSFEILNWTIPGLKTCPSEHIITELRYCKPSSAKEAGTVFQVICSRIGADMSLDSGCSQAVGNKELVQCPSSTAITGLTITTETNGQTIAAITPSEVKLTCCPIA